MSGKGQRGSAAESNSSEAAPKARDSFRRRTIIVVAVAIVLLHCMATMVGGLLDPDETALAESARTLVANEAPFVYPTRPTAETALVPPSATWLAAAGIALAGNGTMAARAFAALSSALLLLGCFIVLSRAGSRRIGYFLCLACLTTPLYALRCGQVGPSAVAATSTLLAISCLSVLASCDATLSRRRWLSVTLGVAVGVGMLSTGPAGAALHAISIMACLVVLPYPASDEVQRWRWLIPPVVALVGAGLFIFGIFDGLSGWPTAASLGRLGCGSGEQESAALLWVGVAFVSVAVIVWRAGQARRLGLHISALVAVCLAAPWTIAACFSSDGAALCTALDEAASRPWQTHVAMADTVRTLGYGMYPWMAFLPLSVLRLTSKPGAPGALAIVIFVFVALSLCGGLVGALPTQPVIVTAAVLIAVVSTIGLVWGQEEESNGVNTGERTACMVGAMLLVVVFKDLVSEPELIPALGLTLQASSNTLIRGSLLAVIIGALTLVSLLLYALKGAKPLRWTPSPITRLIQRSPRYALSIAVVVMASAGLLNLTVGMSRLSSAASWADVFETYEDSRRQGDEIYGWREIGSGGRYYAGRDLSTLSRARDVRRVLSREGGRTFFLMETLAYRQLSEMINRITGERMRPLNDDRQHHVIAVYDGPNLSTIERPAPIVDDVPEHARRRGEQLGRSMQLVGALISAEHAHPGDTVAVELYFRCSSTPNEDHQVRLHLRPRRGGFRHSEAHDPTDDLLPTSQWRPGQVIVDRAELIVPVETEPENYTISVELVGGGGGRRDVGRLDIE